MALRHSPDILVHTGDLFHSPFPHPDDMNFVVTLLKGIPESTSVVMLSGNHDIPYGYRYSQSPIKMLQSAGLLVSTGDKESAEITIHSDGKSLDIHMISWTRRGIFQRYLDRVQQPSNNAMLLTHNIPVEYDELPSHYDYIGFGHSHSFHLDEEYGIGCPGSTCIVDWKKEMHSKRKLIIADIDSNGVEYQTETLNDVREFKFHPGLDITGLCASDANSAIKRWLNELSPKKKRKPIIIVNVNGLVTPDTESGLERSDLIAYGENKLGPLFLHIEPNWEIVGPPRVTLSEPLNIEQSVKEYLEQNEGSDAKQILEELHKIRGKE